MALGVVPRGLARERCQRDTPAGVVDEQTGRAVLTAADFPGVLIAGIRVAAAVAEAPGSALVPVPGVELQVQLGVRPIAEFCDRGHLQAVESSLFVVQGAQHREGEGKDHAVEAGAERAGRAGEGEGVAAVGILCDCPKRRVQHDAAVGQAGRDRPRQLLIPTRDVIALVRRPKDSEIPRDRLKGEQVDKVQRALLRRHVAVLDVVGDVQQLTHWALVASRNARFDPVVNTQPVQGDPGVGVDFVGRGVSGCIRVLVDRVVDSVEVRIGLLPGVVLAEEGVGVVRLTRLRGQEVGRRQLEAAGQLEDRLMAAIDQLAAVLADLVVLPGGASQQRRVGMHAPANPARGLEHTSAIAGILQRQRRVEAGDAPAHDGDSGWRRGEGGDGAAQGGSAGRGPGGLEEIAAGQPGLPSFREVPVEPLEVAQQRRARHPTPPQSRPISVNPTTCSGKATGPDRGLQAPSRVPQLRRPPPPVRPRLPR